jgi:serine phosphatase RsbU (regulator of sigma subunit)/Tfp pilus assembly protein PilF
MKKKAIHTKALVLFLIFSVPAFLFAQPNKSAASPSKKIDSLLSVIKTAKEDTSCANALNEVSKIYLKTGDYRQASQTSQQALKLSRKLSYKKGIAYAISVTGLVAWSKGDSETALTHLFEGLKIREEIKDMPGLANSNNYLGVVYWNQGNYEKALTFYLKALKLFEETNNKDGGSVCLLNIGNIYFNQGNPEKALEYYSKSLKINVETGNKASQATNLNNIGNIYGSKGKFEKSLEYFLRALKITRDLDDKFGTAMAYGNIGMVYFSLNNFDKALESQFKSLEINNEIGNRQGTAVTYGNIGSILVKQNKIAEALRYQNMALDICKSVGYKDGLKGVYSALSELYDKTGDYKKAYEFHKLYTDIKDTLLNEQSTKQVTEMNAKYDSEKKDKELIKKDAEISVQHAETEKQNFERNAFIAGFVLVLLLAAFILRGFRQKQKANRLLDEKNMQITDSITYAQHIQEAMLPPTSEIKNYFNESFLLYMPKDIVSGDFYWLSPPSSANEGVLLAAADCTGHGVPGAFMSVMGVNMLDNIVVGKNITKPALILDELNSVIVQTLHQESENSSAKYGMDIALLNINKKLNLVSYAGAHNSLLIVRDEKLIETKADKTTIGMAREKFTDHIVEIQKGDMLYIFTDGYADQKGGAENKKLFAADFRELLVSLHKKNADDQKAFLEKLFHDRKGTNDQLDDVLIIGIRV